MNDFANDCMKELLLNLKSSAVFLNFHFCLFVNLLFISSSVSITLITFSLQIQPLVFELFSVSDVNYQCSHCLKRCASERLLRDHMRHHGNIFRIIQFSTISAINQRSDHRKIQLDIFMHFQVPRSNLDKK